MQYIERSKLAFMTSAASAAIAAAIAAAHVLLLNY